MSKSKFEALIEHILNDDEAAARELFHDIVVEKSREIYNNIVAEDEDENEEVEESYVDEVHGEDASDDMIGDIEADHTGMGMEPADDEMGHDHEDHDEEGEEGEEEHGDEEIEDRVIDLEAELDALKAEFDKLMAGEEGEEEHGDMEMPEEGVVREYVEKAPAPVKSESGANTKSTVAGKNDMGGKAALSHGGESNPDGTSAPKSAKAGNLPHAGNFENVPGGKAGDAYGKAKAPVGSEVGGTNTKSTL